MEGYVTSRQCILSTGTPGIYRTVECSHVVYRLLKRKLSKCLFVLHFSFLFYLPASVDAGWYIHFIYIERWRQAARQKKEKISPSNGKWHVYETSATKGAGLKPSVGCQSNLEWQLDIYGCQQNHMLPLHAFMQTQWCAEYCSQGKVQSLHKMALIPITGPLKHLKAGPFALQRMGLMTIDQWYSLSMLVLSLDMRI